VQCNVHSRDESNGYYMWELCVETTEVEWETAAEDGGEFEEALIEFVHGDAYVLVRGDAHVSNDGDDHVLVLRVRGDEDARDGDSRSDGGESFVGEVVETLSGGFLSNLIALLAEQVELSRRWETDVRCSYGSWCTLCVRSVQEDCMEGEGMATYSTKRSRAACSDCGGAPGWRHSHSLGPFGCRNGGRRKRLGSV
jgi:hypothetical protein